MTETNDEFILTSFASEAKTWYTVVYSSVLCPTVILKLLKNINMGTEVHFES